MEGLNKQIELVNISVQGEFKYIIITEEVVITEDDVLISRTNQTRMLDFETDVSEEYSDVKKIAGVLWTTTFKNSKKAKLSELKTNIL